jgi:transposase
MLTAMTEEDWTIVMRVFAASRSRRGYKSRNERKFLEALHYFVVHNITWRALPEKFGHWNSVWKRFWRLSRSGTLEAFFGALAAISNTAHLVQMFDSTVATQLSVEPHLEWSPDRSTASGLRIRTITDGKIPSGSDGARATTVI